MCSLKIPVIYFPTKTNKLKSVMSQSVVLRYIACTVQLYSITVYLFSLSFFFEKGGGHPVVYYQICIVYDVPSIHNMHQDKMQ